MINLISPDQILEKTQDLNGILKELLVERDVAEGFIEEAKRVHDDILHRWESKDCLFDERARLATILAESQRNRRIFKDWLRLTAPLIDFADSSSGGDRLFKQLENLIGRARKVEETKARREQK